MEVVIVLLFLGAFGYIVYKVAKSKNREPINWLLMCLLISPFIILIILIFVKKLPVKTKRSVKNNNKKITI